MKKTGILLPIKYQGLNLKPGYAIRFSTSNQKQEYLVQNV